jgi:prevent-host-death family protein
MTDALVADQLANIPQTPASDLKRVGWRGVMKSVAREGRVLVTNHREPEAVILSIKVYTALLDAAAAADRARESELDVLRRSFDERLAALRSPDAGERLRALINEPTRLGGMVKVGASH